MLSNEDRFLESYAIKIQYLCIKIRKFHRTDIFQKKKKPHMYTCTTDTEKKKKMS